MSFRFYPSAGTICTLFNILIAFVPGLIPASAEPSALPISRIKFTGWQPPVKFNLQLNVGDTLNEINLLVAQQAIQLQLTDHGFLNATVEPEISTAADGITLNFRIHTGPRARIVGWQFTGNESFSARELLPLTGHRIRPFSRTELNRVITTIERFYENNGFPFAKVEFFSLEETTTGVRPQLKIDEGPRIKISFLRFSPNLRFNQSLLLQTAGFTKPVYYQPARIARWRFNLRNSGWLRIDSSEIVQQDSLYGIQFFITPLTAGEIGAVFGYSPENNRFIGWADISLRNLFNTGRAARIGWQSLYRQTEYQLQYSEPFPFRLPLTLTGTIRHQVYDTVYAFTTGSASAIIGYEPVRVNLATGFDRLAGSKQKNTVWAGTGLLIDNRNDIGNFTPGMFLKIGTRAGRQSSPDRGTGLIGWLEADWTALIPIVGPFAWNNTVSLRAVYSRLPLNEPELYRLGGLENVRGYRESQFLSDRCGWWNCEPRYYLNTTTRLHLFLDAGLLRAVNGNPELILGYGLGGRWQTKIGVLGIDCGIPAAESPLRAKIHLNFRTGF